MVAMDAAMARKWCEQKWIHAFYFPHCGWRKLIWYAVYAHRNFA
jgi:hypothetical protein